MVSANYTPGDYIFSPQKFGVSTLGYLINLGQGPTPTPRVLRLICSTDLVSYPHDCGWHIWSALRWSF